MCVRKGGGGERRKSGNPRHVSFGARAGGRRGVEWGERLYSESLSLSRIKKSGIRCTMKKHAEDR